MKMDEEIYRDPYTGKSKQYECEIEFYRRSLKDCQDQIIRMQKVHLEMQKADQIFCDCAGPVHADHCAFKEPK